MGEEEEYREQRRQEPDATPLLPSLVKDFCRMPQLAQEESVEGREAGEELFGGHFVLHGVFILHSLGSEYSSN